MVLVMVVVMCSQPGRGNRRKRRVWGVMEAEEGGVEWKRERLFLGIVVGVVDLAVVLVVKVVG